MNNDTIWSAFLALLALPGNIIIGRKVATSQSYNI